MEERTGNDRNEKKNYNKEGEKIHANIHKKCFKTTDKAKKCYIKTKVIKQHIRVCFVLYKNKRKCHQRERGGRERKNYGLCT